MSHLLISKPRLDLAVLVLSALPCLAGAAHAQTQAQAATERVPAAPSAVFHSAFEGYQPYSTEKILDWKLANDHTARIGGWREYARQAQQPVTAHPAAAPDPHAAHTRQAKP